MFQAAIAPSTPSPLAHLFRFLWTGHDESGERTRDTDATMFHAGVAQAATLRSQIEMLRKRAELLYRRAGTQHPAVTERQVGRLLTGPIERLLRENTGKLSPKIEQLLGDSLWELQAVASIGDTMCPVADAAECASLAEGALDETLAFLASAVKALR